ncbi:glycosyltransferase [Halorubrum ezzemoulense]|uniref:glycosyltransferase n=1 Tax=Halorubrum ezzemoulense TaxID=337243 RepID=UPI00232C4E2B|nr:glycosyltransferase [Halorubrum ezzemoulense]MDB9252928.1 glycosyltransferase [Halorubrum ezzemoulense]MDB9256688.1 glycosyltransferase [Halorubrum ezzemoulense]MDB9276995.1 glycosyltransferase [Halorubrum ezzemoulense]
MKVLHVTNFFKPSWEAGGVARYAHGATTALAKRNYDVTVYTTDGYAERLSVKTGEPIDVDGVSTYYFRNLSRKLLDYVHVPIPLQLPATARQEISDFDVVHIHEHRSILALVVAFLANRYNVPYTVQPHGSLPYSTGNSQLKYLFDRCGGHYVLRNADRLLALSKTEQEQFADLGYPSESIDIIRNGTVVSDTENEESKRHSAAESVRSQYGIPSDEPIFLYLGRIHERKGVNVLVDAFEHTDNGHLVIVGPDHGYAKRLQAQIKASSERSRIHYVGFVSEAEKEQWYESADVYMLTSTGSEGLPTTLIEAAAHSLPLIISKKCNAPIVEASNAGRVVELTPPIIADAMQEMLGPIGKEYGRNAQKMIKNSFTWSEIVKDLESVYEAVQ